jgi:hypothetical protein
MQIDWGDRFWSKVHPEALSGCWLWHGAIGAGGYGNFSLGRLGGSQKFARAHRHAWELVNGPVPGGLLVCHRCDNRGCVNPDHMFLGTHGDNNRDMRTKGRAVSHPHGNQFRSRIPDAVVRKVREAFAQGGRTKAAIAREAGITRQHVSDIVRMKCRVHD